MSDEEKVVYPPVNESAPQLTIRAILTGMLLGGVLSLTNIYAGLKIGWGFNMSVTAMLVAFGIYRGAERFGVRRWGMLENNINQTAASSAASISSAGLVAPIPALTILTGQELAYPLLVAWTFAVSLVGVMVAIGLRRQMLIQDNLPFPFGIASAETIKQMYAKGSEAMARVFALIGGALAGAAMKLTAYLASWHAVGPALRPSRRALHRGEPRLLAQPVVPHARRGHDHRPARGRLDARRRDHRLGRARADGGRLRLGGHPGGDAGAGQALVRPDQQVDALAGRRDDGHVRADLLRLQLAQRARGDPRRGQEERSRGRGGDEARRPAPHLPRRRRRRRRRRHRRGRSSSSTSPGGSRCSPSR